MTTQATSLTPRGPKPNRISASRIILYSILVVAAVYYLLPLYVMVATSLKGEEEALAPGWALTVVLCGAFD